MNIGIDEQRPPTKAHQKLPRRKRSQSPIVPERSEQTVRNLHLSIHRIATAHSMTNSKISFPKHAQIVNMMNQYVK